MAITTVPGDLMPEVVNVWNRQHPPGHPAMLSAPVYLLLLVRTSMHATRRLAKFIMACLPMSTLMLANH